MPFYKMFHVEHYGYPKEPPSREGEKEKGRGLRMRYASMTSDVVLAVTLW